MKGIIIYKGKYGATRQYAEWLGESLKIPVITSNDLTPHQLATYDYVIIGSPVYVGKLIIKKWLKRNQDILHNKKVVLFVVCFTASAEKDKQDSIIKENIPESFRKKTETFFLPGRLVKNKLSWIDLFVLNMGSRLQKDQEQKKAMLRDTDEVKKENLEEVILSVQKIMVEQKKGFPPETLVLTNPSNL